MVFQHGVGPATWRKHMVWKHRENVRPDGWRMETTRCDNGHLRQQWQLMKWGWQELLWVTRLDSAHSSSASVSHALCDSETSRKRSSLQSSHTCRAEPWSARSAVRWESSSHPYTAFPRSQSAPESGSTGSLPSVLPPVFVTNQLAMTESI